MRILTHPDNLEAIRAVVHPRTESGRFAADKFYSMEFVAEPILDREKWSGKYVLPDGRVVEPQDVVVPDGRFFEWTAADIWWLLKRGVIRKHMEMLFYVLDDSRMFRGL